jgi:hypothetical protein
MRRTEVKPDERLTRSALVNTVWLTYTSCFPAKSQSPSRLTKRKRRGCSIRLKGLEATAKILT